MKFRIDAYGAYNGRREVEASNVHTAVKRVLEGARTGHSTYAGERVAVRRPATLKKGEQITITVTRIL